VGTRREAQWTAAPQATALNHTPRTAARGAAQGARHPRAAEGIAGGADRLRFDFAFQPVTPAELREIEHLVKRRFGQPPGKTRLMDTKAGGGAPSRVWREIRQGLRVLRLVKSMELCGGTHVHAPGHRLFKIVDERGRSVCAASKPSPGRQRSTTSIRTRCSWDLAA